MRRLIRSIAVASGVVVLASTVPARAEMESSHTIVAAGDIACLRPCRHQRQTARLVRRIAPERVLALGDLQYESGSLREFRRSYDRNWGRFKSRTRPVPGNHEYNTPGAAGFFRYFAKQLRGDDGWYSFDLGRWHLVALNSRKGSPPSARQMAWLRRDLRRDRHACELAYYHHPRWSSGRNHGNTSAMAPFWTALVGHGVDVVLNGHEHQYERFARLGVAGFPSRAGTREFVVGTGGIGRYAFGSPQRGSQVRSRAFGVLRMELGPGHYRWRFVNVGRRTLDSGASTCHG